MPGQVALGQLDLPAITVRMRDRASSYITPISEVETMNVGHALGTGGYVDLGSTAVLMTNEHVARRMTRTPIAHLPRNYDFYVRVMNPMFSCPWPIEVALSRLESDVFSGGQKSALPLCEFQNAFQGACGELLFILGFPGNSTPQFALNPNRRTTYFGVLNTPGVPFLGQEIALPKSDDYDPKMHFAVGYPSEGAYHLDSGFADPPDPHGMSGSLVWSTRVLECPNGTWSPQDAKVCGIVWAWDQDARCLVCTKVEYIHSVLESFRRL